MHCRRRHHHHYLAQRNIEEMNVKLDWERAKNTFEKNKRKHARGIAVRSAIKEETNDKKMSSHHFVTPPPLTSPSQCIHYREVYLLFWHIKSPSEKPLDICAWCHQIFGAYTRFGSKIYRCVVHLCKFIASLEPPLTFNARDGRA